jgi:hypothetical protein
MHTDNSNAVPEPSAAQLAVLDDDDLGGVDLPAFLDNDPALAAAMDELARKQHLLEALQAQMVAEELNRHLRQVNASEGMGEVTRMMPAFAWHDIAAQQGTYDCFKDKSFNRYLDRKAPETKVRCYAPKSGNGLPLQLGWRPSEPKFRKSYGSDESAKCDA